MKPKNDLVGVILITALLILLVVVGVIYYKSIDWEVLNRLESQKLILPTPIPASSSATFK